MRSKQPGVVTTNSDDVLGDMCAGMLYSRSTSKRDGHERQGVERTYFLRVPVCHCHFPPIGLQPGRGSQDGCGGLGERGKRRRREGLQPPLPGTDHVDLMYLHVYIRAYIYIYIFIYIYIYRG